MTSALSSSAPARLLLLLLLAAVPLAVFPPGNDYVIMPKIALAVMGITALGAAIVQDRMRGTISGRPLLLPLGCWVLAVLAAVPGAVNLQQAARLALEQAAWAGLALAAACIVADWNRILAVAALSVAGQFAIALLQMGGRWYVGHGEIFGPGRIYSTFGNPSFMGVYLAPVAVWFLAGAVGDLRTGRRRGAAWKGAALAASLLMLHRAAVIDAWAGLALGGAAALWMLLAGGRRPSRAGLALSIAVLLLGSWAALSALVPRLHDRLDYLKVKAFSWHAAAILWREHPVLGAGPGAFQIEAPRAMARAWALWTGPWKVPPMFVTPHDEAFAHQDLLQLLSETGVAGFGMLAWLALAALRAAGARGRGGVEEASCIGALAAFLPTMCMHFPLHLAPSLLVFWFCLGRAGRAAGPDAGRAPDGEAPASLPAWIRAAAAAAALLAMTVSARHFTSNAYLGRGYRLFLGGGAAQAVPWIERFRAVDPWHFEGRFYGGVIFQALGNDARAIEEYEAALSLYPAMQGAIYNMGNLAFRRRRLAEAIAYYDRVLEVNPGLVDALNNRGNSLGLLERNEEAVRDYLRAAALRPGYTDAMYNLAVTFERMGRKREAREWLARLLKADPDYAPARPLAETLGLRIPRRKAGK